MSQYHRPTVSRRAAAIAACLAVGLAACSSPAESVSSDADEGNQVLTITHFDEGAGPAILKKVGEQFEEEHPGWTVEVTVLPEDNYLTKLRLSVQAGEPPDIATITRVSQTGLFQPITESVYEANDIDVGGYNVATLEGSCGYEGEIYCVGGYSGTTGLFYNKDQFKKAKIPFPSETEPMTMDEYADLASRLTQRDKNGDVVVYGGHAAKPVYWVDPASFLDDTGRKADLLNPEYVHTWETIAGMVLDGDAPWEGGASVSVSDLFAAGDVSMAIADNFIIDKLSANKVDWGVAPTPVQPGQAPYVSSWTTGMGITKTAKHPEEAAEYLALFATIGQEYQAEEGLMPLSTDVADELFASKSPSHQQFAGISRLARPPVWTPNPRNWQAPIQDAWNAATAGDMSVQEALEGVEPKAQQELDTQWRIWEQEQPE